MMLPASYSGPGKSFGVLQFLRHGYWRTVCDEGFGQEEADVVCRQLGYERAYNYGDLG